MLTSPQFSITITRLPILLLLILVVRCRAKDKAYDYKSYPFDREVIARFPLYDSLSRVLLANFAALKEEIHEHSSFDYGRSRGANLVNPKLPSEAAKQINRLMEQLGEKFLVEFSVYKDSTIKYSVRDTNLEGYDITVRERLSYFPRGGTIQRKEPPNKDTILNRNWQYWIRFDERDLF
ncbi:MAG TPA: hypothetical protein VM935_03185 [Chitinophagaceae bacterium]|nr:hypothetical protein [Chitinophagaceae bacterium]